VLTKGELLTLLRQDPELWQKALERGKAARRAQQAKKRRQKYILREIKEQKMKGGNEDGLA
jgi:hypothetical protein